MRKGRQLILLVAINAALLSMTTHSTFGTPFGSTPLDSVGTSVNVGNDYIHPVHIADVQPTNLRDAVQWTVSNVYDPSDLFMFVVAGSTGPSGYDTYYNDLNVSDTNLIGWHACPVGAAQGGTHPNHWCADGHIRFNLYFAYVFDTTNERRGIACHETGHAVGLRHTAADGSDGGFASCMYNSGSSQTRFQTRWGLTTHEYYCHVDPYYDYPGDTDGPCLQ